ncbi:glycosyltransferase family 32 protein [Leuconostoc pseudomesenteroides]|nr:glycosyltransferase [Leuconostoc pseudomesenteroides]
MKIMIPRIVHYAWFGSEKPDEVTDRIKRWKEILPNWKFIEWNESNWDVTAYKFSKTMYDTKNLGYVADPLRFDVLYRYGGLYLDTDMEVKKDLSVFLDEQVLLGFMYDNSILTSFIMGEKGNSFFRDAMSLYAELDYKDLIPSLYSQTSNPVVTKLMKKLYPEFKLNGKQQRINNSIKILPKDFFSYPSNNTEANYTEHLFMNSWGTANLGVRGWLKHVLKRYYPLLWAKISADRGVKSSINDGLPDER